MTGNCTPDTLKPVPVTATELTMTAAVPTDDSVTDCVAGSFTITFPNEIVAAFTLKVAWLRGDKRSEKVAVVPAVAVRVTV